MWKITLARILKNKMIDYKKFFKNLNTLKSPQRKEVIYEFWEAIHAANLSKEVVDEIKFHILNIYSHLDFDERQAALEILRYIKADEIEELFLDNLGEIWQRFKLLGDLLQYNFHILKSYEKGSFDEDIDPFDFNKVFKGSYEILKQKKSKFIQ